MMDLINNSRISSQKLPTDNSIENQQTSPKN